MKPYKKYLNRQGHLVLKCDTCGDDMTKLVDRRNWNVYNRKLGKRINIGIVVHPTEEQYERGRRFVLRCMKCHKQIRREIQSSYLKIGD